MKPRTIKALDYWCGLPICLVLTLWARLGAFVRPDVEQGEARRILFLKLTEQGAIVLAYPAAKRAADRVGPENVFFCVFEEHRHLPSLLGLLPPENIFGVRHANLFVFLWDLLRLFAATRRRAIDAVVDLEFFSRASAAIAYLSGARMRAGYHRFTSEYPNRGDLMTRRVQYNPYLHTAQAYLLLLESLFEPVRQGPLARMSPAALPLCGPPTFSPASADLERVRTLLAKEAPDPLERPFVLVNPNAGDMLPLRKWPASRFEDLIRRLLATYERGSVFVTGAPAERPAAQQICEAVGSPRVLNLAGRTDLEDLLTLYTMSDVLVTNDSGPGHFASLAGLPCVVLFGPETPRLFAPLGRSVRVLYAGLACSPCVNAFNHRFSPCRHNVCMEAISVDEVAAAVCEIVNGRSSRRSVEALL